MTTTKRQVKTMTIKQLIKALEKCNGYYSEHKDNNTKSNIDINLNAIAHLQHLPQAVKMVVSYQRELDKGIYTFNKGVIGELIVAICVDIHLKNELKAVYGISANPFCDIIIGNKKYQVKSLYGARSVGTISERKEPTIILSYNGAYVVASSKVTRGQKFNKIAWLEQNAKPLKWLNDMLGY